MPDLFTAVVFYHFKEFFDFMLFFYSWIYAMIHSDGKMMFSTSSMSHVSVALASVCLVTLSIRSHIITMN